MLPLLFALHLALAPIEPAPPPPSLPPVWTGRLLTRPELHVGVRIHGYADGIELAGAVTLQLRFDPLAALR